MAVRYYRDSEGNYIGAYDDDIPAPVDGTEVPFPPDDARQVWDGGAWGDIPQEVPPSVTPLQARRALRQSGLYDSVVQAIEQADDDTKDAWEYATAFMRDDPIINQLATQLELTEEQVDALFILAGEM